jgi:type I restriction enzyme S subunit
MIWKHVKFIDVFDFEKKSQYKAGEGLPVGEFPFYTSSNVLTKYINEYLFEKPSLIFGTGGMPSVHFCKGKFTTSTDCFVVTPRNINEVLPEFVYYYFAGNMNILEEGFKGAGLRHISKEYINEIKIPLPPYEEQKRIATILDKAQNVVQKQKARIEKYDELAQSAFLEMILSKENSWPLVKFSSLASPTKGSMRTGPFGSDLLHSEFVSSGIYVLGIDNVVNNKFELTGTRYITPKKYDSLKRYRVYPNDVLISIMGTTGRTAIVPQEIPVAINTKHLVAITLNLEIVNPNFISFSLRSNPKIVDQLLSKQRGAIMNGLNLGLIKDLNINIPPFKIQNQLSKVLEQIEAQKAKSIIATSQSEHLFSGLIQKLFNGKSNRIKAKT